MIITGFQHKTSDKNDPSSCVDPERFVRGCPKAITFFFFFFFFFKVIEDPDTTLSGPPSLNVDLLAL